MARCPECRSRYESASWGLDLGLNQDACFVDAIIQGTDLADDLADETIGEKFLDLKMQVELG